MGTSPSTEAKALMQAATQLQRLVEILRITIMRRLPPDGPIDAAMKEVSDQARKIVVGSLKIK